MQKVKRASVLLILLTVGFTSTQCFPEDDLVPICYYGVTQMVSPKIAKRYEKLGATRGVCGSENIVPHVTN